ncbi:MAG: hypothetical protein IJW45_06750 [Oscillospiraceae bacterium]|nr:hypothetical protein [Oscillospiraceae bacterium]
MKKILAALMALTMLLSFLGCQVEEAELVTTVERETTQPTVPSQETTEPSQETTAPTQATEPTTQPPAVEKTDYVERTLSEDYTIWDLSDELAAMLEAGELEERYTLQVDGLCTPVTMEMEQQDVHTVSVYDTTLEVQCAASQGSMNLTLDDYEGIIVINDVSDETPRAWIVTEYDWHLYDQEQGIQTWLWVAEDGIRYRSCVRAYLTSLEQYDQAPLEEFQSRSAFVCEEGWVDIKYRDPERIALAVYTIGQLYDLDQVFRQAKAAGMYPDYESVDQLYASRSDRRQETGDVIWQFDGKGVLLSRRQDQSSWRNVYSYDTSGQIQTVQLVDTDGQTCQQWDFRDHKVVSGWREDRYEDQEEVDRRQYTYDEAGHVLTETRYWDGSLDYVYGFDTFRNKTMEERYLDGALIWRTSFTWDDAGEEVVSYESEAFDDQGRVYKKTHLEGGYVDDWYFGGGQETWSCTYLYDEAGTLTEQRREASAQGETVWERTFCFYDHRGLLVAKYNAEEGEIYSAGYDDQGRITGEVNCYGPESDGSHYTYAADGSSVEDYTGATYGYGQIHRDPQGRVVREEHYGDGDLERGCAYRYDDQGLLVWMESFSDYHDTRTFTYTYEYDDRGNWTHQHCYEAGLLISTTVRVYDQAGNLIQIYETSDGVVLSDQIFAYDDQGRLIADDDYDYAYDDQGRLVEKVSNDGQGDTWRYVYCYDQEGRLLEEVCSVISEE